MLILSILSWLILFAIIFLVKADSWCRYEISNVDLILYFKEENTKHLKT